MTRLRRKSPLIRAVLVGLGVLLILLTPLVGVIPGPGGIFVFAAVATPSQDPFTMLALALPTVVLFEVAEVIAYVHDRRKAARPDPYAGLSDDEVSPLDWPDASAEAAEDTSAADR